LDQRGFGESGGDRGKIVSYENTVRDELIFHQRYLEHYPHLKELPKFIVAESFGCQLAVHCRQASPDTYAGLCLLGPDFRRKDEDFLQKVTPALSFLADFVPKHYEFNIGFDERQLAHTDHWERDQKHLGLQKSLHTVIELKRSLAHINDNNLFDELACPLLIQSGGRDLNCDHDTLLEFFERAPAKSKKRMIHYLSADHMLLADGEYLQLACNDIIRFMDDVTETKR